MNNPFALPFTVMDRAYNPEEVTHDIPFKDAESHFKALLAEYQGNWYMSKRIKARWLIYVTQRLNHIQK